MAPAIGSFIDLPPWPTGWGDTKIVLRDEPLELLPVCKGGHYSFSGIYYGDMAAFRVDDVFFAVNTLWQVTRSAYDAESIQVDAQSLASIKDLVKLLPLPETITQASKHLWECKHSYYCNLGNYFASGRDQPVTTHKSFAHFLAEEGDADKDYNLLFRWDWQEENEETGDSTYSGDDNYRNGKLLLFQ